MHYKPRKRPPKVETERFEFDFRLIDLLEICAFIARKSKNVIFEEAIKSYCKGEQFLEFDTKIKVRRKYLLRPETMELFEDFCWRNSLSKNAIANKALKNYLVKKLGKARILPTRIL